MAKKIILAGVLGGVAFFVWQMIAHMVLPIGEVGVKALDKEDAVVAQLKANIGQPGFYIFPAPDMTPGQTREQQQAASQKMMDKYRAGPSGILIIQTGGQDFSFAKLLLVQCSTNILAGLLGAWLLSQATGLTSFGGRLLFVTLLGAVPTLAVNLPYWNWYGFPTNYTVAQFADQEIGYFVLGLVLAAMIKPKA